MAFDKSLLFAAYNEEKAITHPDDHRTDAALSLLQSGGYNNAKYSTTKKDCQCGDRVHHGAVCKHMRAERIRARMQELHRQRQWKRGAGLRQLEMPLSDDGVC